METHQYGWIPDSPDHRDYQFAALDQVLPTLPPQIDLTDLCPPVYDQGNKLRSCTANAIAAAVEFDLMKQKLNVFVPSRLFLYYNVRAMAGTVNSDAGASIRDGIKSVATQGNCPDPLWPYDVTKFAVKPPANCYAEATKYKVVNYQSVPQGFNQLKGCLASGYPFVFGIKVYQSLDNRTVKQTGHAPMPAPGEKLLGNHAVMAVGYDDSNQWFMVRNSWGTEWGLKGYFTLPYSFLINGNLSGNFWTIRVVT
jgi:C1A family cysteine protease